MHDAALMQRVERREDAERNRNRLRGCHRAPLQPRRQRFALKQLHGEKRIAFVLADLEQLADVWMADRGGGTRLAKEPVAHHRVRRRQDRLDGDRTLQAFVHGFVDDAHAAAADLADDPVTADAVAQGSR